MTGLSRGHRRVRGYKYLAGSVGTARGGCNVPGTRSRTSWRDAANTSPVGTREPRRVERRGNRGDLSAARRMRVIARNPSSVPVTTTALLLILSGRAGEFPGLKTLSVAMRVAPAGTGSRRLTPGTSPTIGRGGVAVPRDSHADPRIRLRSPDERRGGRGDAREDAGERGVGQGARGAVQAAEEESDSALGGNS